MISLAYKFFHCLSANHNPELRCVIYTGVALFALVLHLNCTALSQSESSNFSCVLLEPLYLALRIWSERTRDFFEAFLFFLKFTLLYFGNVFNKTILPLALVRYEMIIANSALCVSLAIYHLISNARLWNNG